MYKTTENLIIGVVKASGSTTRNLYINNLYSTKESELKIIAPYKHLCYSLSNVLPIFDIEGDMISQIELEVVKNSLPQTRNFFISANYYSRFIPVRIEVGTWEVVKPSN